MLCPMSSLAIALNL
jgi:predicted RNase H-like HicB family nuclease